MKEWISIKHRLPDSRIENVLVCHLNKDGNKFVNVIDSAYWVNGKFVLTTRVITKCGQITVVLNDVTHWMPLPEPPK